VINFRYHVVLLTAVFLALAIGLIVGTAALNGPVANDLQSRVSQLSKE
jgi:Copper transport outer membrane protein, MctB